MRDRLNPCEEGRRMTAEEKIERGLCELADAMVVHRALSTSAVDGWLVVGGDGDLDAARDATTDGLCVDVQVIGAQVPEVEVNGLVGRDPRR